MVMTRSTRDLEIQMRCYRAVNLFTNLTMDGAEYRYTTGMLTPLDLDLLVWLLCFIAITASQDWTTVEGPWVEREKRYIIHMIDDEWMHNHAVHVPPVSRKMLYLFRTGQHTYCNCRLLRACLERTVPVNVLLHLGYWVVAGQTCFHMIGRDRVLEEPVPEVPPVLVYGQLAPSSAASTVSATGTLYDAGGNQI